MSPQAANLTDAGIGIVGSLGAGLATAPIRISTIRAADPLAQGLSNAHLLSRWDVGSKALNSVDYMALGGNATSTLAKAPYIAAGMNMAGNPLTTTALQNIGKSGSLIFTGLTPRAAGPAGMISAGLNAVGGGIK